MQIEMLPPHALRPYRRNAQTHSKRQIKQIAASMKRFGFTNPILVSDDCEIIAGHGRFEAAKLLGLAGVPVVRLSHLSEDERRAWRREWDSNPRYGFPYTRFPSVRLKPLGHPSAGARLHISARTIVAGGGVATRLAAAALSRSQALSVHQPHSARLAHIIAAELVSALAEGGGAHETEQRLRSGQEVVALAQHKIETLPGHRHEAEPGRLRH
jgi:hypothetical protein